MDKLCSTVGGTGTVEAHKCQKVVGCGHRNKRSESHANTNYEQWHIQMPAVSLKQPDNTDSVDDI